MSEKVQRRDVLLAGLGLAAAGIPVPTTEVQRPKKPRRFAKLILSSGRHLPQNTVIVAHLSPCGDYYQTAGSCE